MLMVVFSPHSANSNKTSNKNGVWAKHCKTEFKKQVFPMFIKPWKRNRKRVRPKLNKKKKLT